MLRLPRFRHEMPSTASAAATLVAEHTPGRAMFVAGGTDLFPNLKRRQFDVDLLVQVPPAGAIAGDAEAGFTLGATVTLAAAARHPGLAKALPGYAEAAGQVSSPPLRNAGTIGGNLCVDTRCNYYNQTHEWRKAIGYCMKKDGDICLVAPGSPRCWAVTSSDTAPVAIALGATVVLAGPDAERELPVAALYRDDGIDYLAKQPYEVVTALRLPPPDGVRTAYVKLRRRGSIDFPIAGCGVALHFDGDVVTDARIVLSAVGSHPVEPRAAGEFLVGKRFDEEVIAHAAELAAKPAKPLDNADLSYVWRKKMVRVVVEDALRRAASAPTGSA